MKNNFRLDISPNWEEIEPTQARCADFLIDRGLAREAVDSIIMVIGELVENGIKYGSYSASEEELIIEVSLDGNLLSVEAINPIDDRTTPHLRDLDSRIQWIRGFQDPFEAFVERIRIVSKKPLEDRASGLGLVRIAYEGRAILDFFTNEDDTLNVSAVMHL